MTDGTTAQTGTGTTTADTGAATGAEKIETGAATGTDKGTGATADASKTLGGGGEGSQDTATEAAAKAAAKDGAKDGNVDKTAAAEQSWRDRLAGGDATLRKQLDRYASEADVGKKIRALEQKLSSGEYRKALAADAKPEEIAAYRKEIGVPEKAEEYKVELPNGIVLGEGDKPVVELFKQFAHGKNMAPADFNATLAWYYETQDAIASQQADKDGEFKTKAEDELRAEYGQDYRRNMNVLGAVRDSMPDGLADRLLTGRLADGTVIGNDPAVLRWLIGQGLELNPASTVIPGGSGDPAKTVASRLEEIRSLRRDSPDKYEPQRAKLEAEEIELLDAQSKMKKRAA